jgi:hypothetical protein
MTCKTTTKSNSMIQLQSLVDDGKEHVLVSTSLTPADNLQMLTQETVEGFD